MKSQTNYTNGYPYIKVTLILLVLAALILLAFHALWQIGPLLLLVVLGFLLALRQGSNRSLPSLIKEGISRMGISGTTST